VERVITVIVLSTIRVDLALALLPPSVSLLTTVLPLVDDTYRAKADLLIMLCGFGKRSSADTAIIFIWRS
jgi:hypothetical protein